MTETKNRTIVAGKGIGLIGPLQVEILPDGRRARLLQPFRAQPGGKRLTSRWCIRSLIAAKRRSSETMAAADWINGPATISSPHIAIRRCALLAVVSRWNCRPITLSRATNAWFRQAALLAR